MIGITPCNPPVFYRPKYYFSDGFSLHRIMFCSNLNKRLKRVSDLPNEPIKSTLEGGQLD